MNRAKDWRLVMKRPWDSKARESMFYVKNRIFLSNVLPCLVTKEHSGRFLPIPTYLYLPTYSFLPILTYQYLPTYTYLPILTYLYLPTYTYLPILTYLYLSIYTYPPKLTYLYLSIYTYPPLLTFLCLTYLWNSKTVCRQYLNDLAFRTASLSTLDEELFEHWT